MSNKIIALWGFIVVSIVAAILVIGFNYKKELEYVDMKQTIRKSVYAYMGDNDVTLPFKISTEKLEEENYLDELKLGDRLCAADVMVDKKFIIYKYDIEFTCVDVSKEANV